MSLEQAYDQKCAECVSLREQLAVREKQIVMLREAIDRQPYTMDKQVCEALAATDDLDGYILCEKEPVEVYDGTEGTNDYVKLYRARRPE